MKKFIYVFSNEDKEKLSNYGYLLLKEDKENGIFVFVNEKNLEFALCNDAFVLSDTLTF